MEVCVMEYVCGGSGCGGSSVGVWWECVGVVVVVGVGMGACV